MNNAILFFSAIATIFLFRKREPKIGMFLNSEIDRINNSMKFKPLAEKYASVYPDIDAELILAVIVKESGGNPNALGASGEKGLMQVKDIAVADVWENERFASFDPETNIRHASAFLQVQINRCGSIKKGLGCYNQGKLGASRNPVKAENYANDVLRIKKNIENLSTQTPKTDSFLFL